MEYESSEAFIFNLVDYSNTSKIISFLTSSTGRISCIAKGIKRKNNPWKFFADRLNLVEIQYTWKSTREVQTLTEMSLIDNYPEIKKNIYRQTLASLVLEYAYYLTPRDEKSDSTFAITKLAFELISNPNIPLPDIHKKVPLFQWHLLKIHGIEPQLKYCCICGSPISSILKFSFKGGVVCDKCPYHLLLSKEEANFFYLLSQFTEDEGKILTNIPKQNLTKLVILLCNYLKFHIEQNLNSLTVYKELFQ